MKILIKISLLIIPLVFAGCGNDQIQNEGAANEAPLQPGQKPEVKVLDIEGSSKVTPSAYAQGISGEWRYERIEEEVFAGVGETVEWNGRPINDANAFISMTVGGLCGKTNCGKQVNLVNSHGEQVIRAVLTVPYEVENNLGAGYIARAYTIQPGEKLLVGCTHLCDGEDAFEFRRAIVVSEFVKKPVQ